MTNEELKAMSMDEANRKLTTAEDQRRWVEIHNRGFNIYVIRNYKIKEVPPEGWYY
jgi:hypothetical protein